MFHMANDARLPPLQTTRLRSAPDRHHILFLILCHRSFRGAVQLNRNTATYAGGFYNVGGTTTFKKRVTMRDNGAQENGGAFSLSGGTVTFQRPDKVKASGNYIYGGQTSGGVVRIT